MTIVTCEWSYVDKLCFIMKLNISVVGHVRNLKFSILVQQPYKQNVSPCIIMAFQLSEG